MKSLPGAAKDHRQYRRWTTSGFWDVLLQALADGAVTPTPSR
ncbi:hypothetical protein [Teichococcus oryzae]|nr:hypothetical protein [Pseudoroseomonas oryzae]